MPTSKRYRRSIVAIAALRRRSLSRGRGRAGFRGRLSTSRDPTLRHLWRRTKFRFRYDLIAFHVEFRYSSSGTQPTIQSLALAERPLRRNNLMYRIAVALERGGCENGIYGSVGRPRFSRSTFFCARSGLRHFSSDNPAA